VPSRWEAQQDAVNLIFSAKTGANPESSVGLMSMGGSTPEILTTLTTDIGKVLDGLHRTKIRGDSHFVTGINVAAVCIGLKTWTMQQLTRSSSLSSTGRTSRRSNG
jgi:26S proteasome regulatory subunit N10